MIKFESIVKNCKFIVTNLDVLNEKDFYEFNAFINYFVDRVIESKYYRRFDKK